MSLLTIKLLLLLAVFVAAFAGGLVPLAHRGGPDSRFLSRGNSFAAGIFLGSGLIHMLGEAQSAWRALGWEYPMAHALAAAAFAGILLFEHVLLPESAHQLVHAHPHEGEAPARAVEPEAEGAKAYLLTAALSIHSVVAGIALGAQDVVGSVVVISVAILAHKSTEGFALGAKLAGDDRRSRARPLLLFFSLMTPAGIVLGILVSRWLAPPVEHLFDAAFLALAAGTFLYIASLDVLQDEFLRPGDRLAKWLAAAAGLAVTAVLAIWI